MYEPLVGANKKDEGYSIFLSQKRRKAEHCVAIDVVVS